MTVTTPLATDSEPAPVVPSTAEEPAPAYETLARSGRDSEIEAEANDTAAIEVRTFVAAPDPAQDAAPTFDQSNDVVVETVVEMSVSDDPPPPVHSLEDELAAQEPPPPQYDGVVPNGMVALASIYMNYQANPKFFDITLPSRLVNKLPNLTYVTRMAGLNAKLQETNIKRSIQIIRYGSPLMSALVALGVIGGVGSYYIARSTIGLVVGLAIAFFTATLVPRKANYIRVIEKACAAWSEEDRLLGLGLMWKAHHQRISNWNPIEVAVIVFEQVGLRNDEEAELPQHLTNATNLYFFSVRLNGQLLFCQIVTPTMSKDFPEPFVVSSRTLIFGAQSKGHQNETPHDQHVVLNHSIHVIHDTLRRTPNRA
ncbi:hypothetical protein BC830DRAFT_210968 [Chytriomyces sp. MP71]|nr:hypothetical protein BC830DRAFT_210968 [Chytriomyces sp. MP71]